MKLFGTNLRRTIKAFRVLAKRPRLENVKPVCSPLEDEPVWFYGSRWIYVIPRGALVKLNPKFFI